MKKFIPYGRQSIDEKDIRAVIGTLKSDYLTQGPKVEEFEKALCDYTGARYCLAVSNGTAALHLAVSALGIGSNSEGITATNTFVASANCLIYSSITPVLADIDVKTYNVDPEKIEEKITDRTKVVVAVDFAGQPAEMKKIYGIAKKRKLFLIEDASHAIGSRYPDHVKVGSCRYSDLTTFSFHPVKTITTGEGGAITTNNEKLYKKLLHLRSHGITKDQEELSVNPGPWYLEMQDLGYNYRITDIQSALGISQLDKLDKFVLRRRDIVSRYNQAFSTLKNCTIPFEQEGNYSAFHLYVLQFDFEKIGKNRKQVMEELLKKNIGTQVHYIPVHLQPYYQKKYGYKAGDFPIAEEYYQKCLSLPLYPKMTDAEIAYVIKSINQILS